MTTLTIELSEAVLSRLQEEADARGRSASSLVAEWIETRHAARERARTEAQAILNGPRHRLEEADERFRRRHDLAEVPAASREEMGVRFAQALASVDPECVAEAERQGLI